MNRIIGLISKSCDFSSKKILHLIQKVEEGPGVMTVGHFAMEQSASKSMDPIQIEMFSDLLLYTWKQVMNKYGINSKSSFKTMVMRTAYGYHWQPGASGGSDPYLNYECELRLLHLLEKSAEENKCLRTCDVITIAHSIRLEMQESARTSLHARRCFNLESQIPIDAPPPSRSWLNSFCNRHNLRLVDSQTMEKPRCLACEKSRIVEYFLKYLPLFNRDPRLIFGADETDMAPSDNFKVVTDSIHGGHTEEDDSITHISAMCCHSASGISVPPMILLSGLAALPKELHELSISQNNVAWFCSTPKGYMNESAFFIWALNFCHWLSGYRAANLPDSIKRAEILLIMDGHGSRKCPEALNLFRFHNVCLLILPAHCTHLLQPFDVGLASSLKINFRRYLFAEKRAINNEEMQTKASRIRLIMIRAFIRAWMATASPQICSRSFESVGIFPPSPFHVLKSPFISEKIEIPEENNEINNKIITNPEIIEMLRQNMPANRPYIFNFSFNGTQTEILQCVNWMMNNSQFIARLLTPPPTLFWPDTYGVFRVYLTFTEHVYIPVTTQNMTSMIQSLINYETARGDQIINDYVAAQHNLLQETIIKETAKRYGSEIAYHILQDRMKGMVEMTKNGFREKLNSIIFSSLEASNIPEGTKRLLIQNISNLAEVSLGEAEKNLVGYPDE